MEPTPSESCVEEPSTKLQSEMFEEQWPPQVCFLSSVGGLFLSFFRCCGTVHKHVFRGIIFVLHIIQMYDFIVLLLS